MNVVALALRTHMMDQRINSVVCVKVLREPMKFVLCGTLVSRWETGGAYQLHGKPGNSSWEIKWYASFHLEYF